jgi:hypothetical protein
MSTTCYGTTVVLSALKFSHLLSATYVTWDIQYLSAFLYCATVVIDRALPGLVLGLSELICAIHLKRC